MSTADFNLPTKLFTYSVLICGAFVCALAIFQMPLEKVDVGLLFLAAITLLFASRLSIQMPGSKVRFLMGDSLIFLCFLLYGGESAILLAGTEALCASFRWRAYGVNIKTLTIWLNTGLMMCSTAITYIAFLSYSSLTKTSVYSANLVEFIPLLGLLALVQFAGNNFFTALGISIKTKTSFWEVFTNSCLSSSVIYVIGAAVAGIAYKLIINFNFLAVSVVVLIVALLYLTYRHYLSQIKASQELAAEAESRRLAEAAAHIADLQSSKENFRHAALHDPLTGLPNRAFLFEQISAKLAAHENFCLLFMDLNRFKKVNDSLGHDAGDRLLIQVAARLKETIRRQGDFVARLGGDEFAIVIEQMERADYASNFAERVEKTLSSPFYIEGQQIFTGASIGIVVSNNEYQAPEEILRDADLAQYHSKENQTGCSVFDRELRIQAIQSSRLENDLHDALKRDELRVFYQPILSLETGFLAGFEALIRWQHPERGLIPPLDFIPLAESTGLIAPITLWVLREACTQLSRWRWHSRENRCLFMSVNLSGKHFVSDTLAEDTETILIETGIQPACLKLEITESAVMQNAAAAAQVLQKLRELGVSLAIDDFGTGYSSLSHLHEFPLDTLKIDRSFVSRMEPEATKNTQIITTIVTLGKALKMDLVAEGVETFWQAEALRKLGVKYAQGFLFSKPKPAAELEEMISLKRKWLGASVADDKTENEIENIKIPNRTVLTLEAKKPAAREKQA